MKTLLGAMYLSLEPEGDGQLEEGSTIPVERTTSPFDVVDAFEGLAETSAEIDTDQLAASLTTLADLTRNTPEEFQNALSGVSALSETVASRDEQINSLLQNLESVSTVLNARDEDIVTLMRDSDVLFRALVGRREAVHNLLVVDLDPVQGADRARVAEPRGPEAGPRATSRTCSPCSTRTRTTSTTACG